HNDKVCVCETSTGKEVWWLNHDGLVTSVVFAADGKSLLTSTGANAYLWTLHPPPLAAEPAALWADLSGDDPAKAYRAAWGLVDRPELACRLLPDKLRPPEPVDVKHIERWIGNLDSKVFSERETATRELAAHAAQAAPFLEKALANAKSLEASTRIERLLQ